MSKPIPEVRHTGHFVGTGVAGFIIPDECRDTLTIGDRVFITDIPGHKNGHFARVQSMRLFEDGRPYAEAAYQLEPIVIVQGHTQRDGKRVYSVTYRDPIKRKTVVQKCDDRDEAAEVAQAWINQIKKSPPGRGVDPEGQKLNQTKVNPHNTQD